MAGWSASACVAVVVLTSACRAAVGDEILVEAGQVLSVRQSVIERGPLGAMRPVPSDRVAVEALPGDRIRFEALVVGEHGPDPSAVDTPIWSSCVGQGCYTYFPQVDNPACPPEFEFVLGCRLGSGIALERRIDALPAEDVGVTLVAGDRDAATSEDCIARLGESADVGACSYVVREVEFGPTLDLDAVRGTPPGEPVELPEPPPEYADIEVNTHPEVSLVLTREDGAAQWVESGSTLELDPHENVALQVVADRRDFQDYVAEFRDDPSTRTRGTEVLLTIWYATAPIGGAWYLQEGILEIVAPAAGQRVDVYAVVGDTRGGEAWAIVTVKARAR